MSKPKNPSNHQKHVHLAKIAQIGGAGNPANSKSDSKVLSSSSRSYLSKQNITTFSANSRDTTLETHQELDDYSKRLIEKEANAILEGEFDDQVSLSSIKEKDEEEIPKPKDPKKKALPKIEFNKVTRTPGISGYLNYLHETDDYDLNVFRQKMKDKLKFSELNRSSPSLNRDSSFLGSKLHDVIVQRQSVLQRQDSLPEIGQIKIIKQSNFAKNSNKKANSTMEISRTEKNQPLTRKSSVSNIKTEKVDPDQLKKNLQVLAKEYEIFINFSSRDRAIYDKIKDYILDKPEMVRIFYTKKGQRFKENLTQHDIYKGLLVEADFTNRGLVRPSRIDSSNSPYFRRKTQLVAASIKIPERLYEQIKFFIAELQEVNLNYQIEDILQTGERLERKEEEIQNKYYRLAKKLYYADRNRYHKFCELIDHIEKDRPYLRIRLDDKLTDFERHAGELPLINNRTREIGKAWDNLITKWTNYRERIVIRDNS